MDKRNIVFDRKINKLRYIIYKFELGNGESYATIKSAIPNEAPVVEQIEYSEETQTFQMTDYVKVGDRKVKVIFNLNLNLRIVGFIYNDLDGSYDTIESSDYFSTKEGTLDTATVYANYRIKLCEKLAKKLEEQEKQYNENNQKMLNLANKK